MYDEHLECHQMEKWEESNAKCLKAITFILLNLDKTSHSHSHINAHQIGMRARFFFFWISSHWISFLNISFFLSFFSYIFLSYLSYSAATTFLTVIFCALIHILFKSFGMCLWADNVSGHFTPPINDTNWWQKSWNQLWWKVHHLFILCVQHVLNVLFFSLSPSLFVTFIFFSLNYSSLGIAVNIFPRDYWPNWAKLFHEFNITFW